MKKLGHLDFCHTHLGGDPICQPAYLRICQPCKSAGPEVKAGSFNDSHHLVIMPIILCRHIIGQIIFRTGNGMQHLAKLPISAPYPFDFTIIYDIIR